MKLHFQRRKHAKKFLINDMGGLKEILITVIFVNIKEIYPRVMNLKGEKNE